MSGLHQPLLIANVNYHVGHQVAIRVAEGQGYFGEEGLTHYVYDWKGLLPASMEREGLALAMREHGVDIATAADVNGVIAQRERGEDLYIVGGWRYTPDFKWYGAKHLTDLPAGPRGALAQGKPQRRRAAALYRVGCWKGRGLGIAHRRWCFS